MKVLLVGSGGREHALAWRISQSPKLDQLWTAGGNSGTAALGVNLDLNPEDVDAVTQAARSVAAELVVVGPEVPLALGLVDRLTAVGIPAFGPTRAAAQIEASKAFALEVMRESGVPCPDFQVFDDEPEALAFLEKHPGPMVVKADGLAAGKGVSLCPSYAESAAAVRACMSEETFGTAGKTVVLEEMLSGPEVSVFAFTDGQTLSPLAAACDYKRLRDGDLGPNTGGMGSYAPPGFWRPSLAKEIADTVMAPVVRAMARRGTPFQGVLYAGLMLTLDGPKVLEFNCRLGDPETQVLMPALESDPLDVFLACCRGGLSECAVKWSGRHHVGVVLVSGGYPGSYSTGMEVSGLNSDLPGTMVFHAGAKLDPQRAGGVLTSGGRVLTVVGQGDSLDEARSKAYERAGLISFPKAFYRRDIGALRAGEMVESSGWPAPTG